ncbi:DNA/RNA non-specific endonuclease [Thalassiella azotivora]
MPTTRPRTNPTSPTSATSPAATSLATSRRPDAVTRVLADPELAGELGRLARRRRAVHPQEAAPAAAPPPFGGAERGEHLSEAIVLRFGRPTLVVRNDTFEVPEADTWRSRLEPFKARLDAALRSVGRVEVLGVGADFVGTAWVVAPGVVVTNRHVALLFARGTGTDVSLRTAPDGRPYQVRVDFAEEHGLARSLEVPVSRVLYVADDDDSSPDLAVLELTGEPAQLPPPVPLAEADPPAGAVVATVGYPAEDPRNDAADQARLFGGVFDVKRLAPGEVVTATDAGFTHDCTTLGGSSGSVVLDVASGAAVGLHFAGRYLDANYAVGVAALRRHLELAGVRLPTAAPVVPVPAPRRPPAPGPGPLRHRTGFDETFLGDGHLRVPLPGLVGDAARDAVVVDPDADGTARHRLDYQHFSVVLDGRRRLARFTAVMIDGARTRRLKRSRDRWSLDPRVPADVQVGEELYADNDLDRGHLVRRLDPAWGTAKAAERGNDDTFYFTNCTPQHARFNQRTWLELEDYLLDSAATRGFRACVLTGPVLAEDDPAYRGVALPRSYWKVAVMVRAESDELSATGYVVSQADLLTDLELVYGAFRTYQVPLRRVEAMTDLRFGPLRDADPLETADEAAVVQVTREVHGPADLAL